MVDDVKIRAGWRTRLTCGVGTWDDYVVYKGHILARYVAGALNAEQRDEMLVTAAERWRDSPHYDGRP
jgi:hypothetical protein